MPDNHEGIQTTRRIVEMSPHIGVLVLTMFEEDHLVFEAMRAGARGYLLKGTNRAELLRAIEAINNGEAIFSSTIASRLMDYFANMRTAPQAQVFPELSDRERELLTLMAQGYSNSEIAAQLVISEKTVRNHVSNIFSKLHVADRTQAILKARDAGLG